MGIGTPLGQRALNEILQSQAAKIRKSWTMQTDQEQLSEAFQTVWDIRHYLGGYWGYREGYYAGLNTARLLLNDKAQNDITRIIRRHPWWTTKQICRDLDRRDKKFPSSLAGASTCNLWEDAIKGRGTPLARRVEKHISRIKIAVKKVENAKEWKNQLESGLIPMGVQAPLPAAPRRD